MNYIKRTTLLLLSILCVGVMLAQRVTLDQARQKAENFMRGAFSKHGRHFVPGAMHHSPGQQNADAAYYVFNVDNNGGFVIVSGDERTEAILGYSTRGTLDKEQMPDNLRAWLKGYEEQIEWMDSHGDNLRMAPESQLYDDIAPLVTTTWNQNAPYNDYCPLFCNTSQRCVTGCVATAMAQVLAYYGLQPDVRQPARTIKAIPAYECETYWSGYGHISIAQKDPVTFDWDNMLTSYNGSETSNQKAAVARLMEYCGAAVQMDYGISGNGGSGVYTTNIPSALRYFDFDGHYVSRNHYSYNRWSSLIYNELAEGRPVQYGGQSSGGGHAFVVDGYQDGLFHVNWGWGGWCDGYFVLSVLNSGDNSGIGASSSNDGYSFGQDAIIGIMPAEGTYYEEPLQLTFRNIILEGNTITFSAYNLTGSTQTFDFGLAYADGATITPIPGYTGTNIELENTYGPENIPATINGNSLQPGSHAIVTISKLSSSATWLSEMSVDYNYIEAIVDNNHNVTLKMHPTPSLDATDINTTGTLMAGDEQTVTTTIDNDGDEFYGVLYLFASQDSDSKGTFVSRAGATIQAGSSETMAFTFTPAQTGTWHLWITSDAQGDDVIGQTQVQIAADPYTPVGPLMVSNLTVAHAAGDWEVDKEGNRVVDVTNEETVLRITPEIKNISGSTLSGTLNMKFYLEHQDGNTWSKLAEYRSWSGTQITANQTMRFSEMPLSVPGNGTYRFVLELNDNVLDCHYVINYSTGKSPVITFADAEVKRICVENWDTDGDGELSEDEAAAVTDLGDVFEDNTTIVSFNELEYFTGLEELHHAFDSCEKLESIVIPKNIDDLGRSHPFSWCYKLKNIRVAEGNTTYDSRDNCNAIIETETNTLVKGGINTKIPKTVTVIGEDAFESVANLTAITIPSGVKTIKSSAFAFTPLASVTIPASVTAIANYAFQGTTELKSIKVEEGNTVYDSRDNCNAIIETATATLVSGCVNTVIPNTVKHIGSTAFCNHEELASITLPTSIETIGESAFFRCRPLTEISLPAGMKSIGSNAFDGCDNLKDVYSYAVTPYIIGDDIFSVCDKAILHVPYGSKAAYQQTDGWKKFQNVVEIYDAVTVTAKSYSRVYGEENPAFELTTEGGELVGTPVVTCEATATSPVGTYDIIVQRGTIENEDLTLVKGTLTITKAPLTIAAGQYTKKQGEPLPEFKLTYTGFKNEETNAVLTKQPVVACDATESSAPGVYPVKVSGAEAQNYDISYTDGSLTVTAADAIVVTVKSVSREYGNDNPVFEYSVEGGTLTGLPEITCEASKSSPVGEYAISIGQGSVQNFNVSFVSGTLTVTKAPLTIAAGQYTKKQGEPLPEFTLTYTGFKNEETNAVLTKQPTISCAATETSAPGSYPVIVADAEADNYTITYVNGTLTIKSEASDKAIVFADATVKALCVANWDTDGDGELSEQEAAAVTSLGSVFRDNDDIRTFDELQYFTALRDLDSGIFYGCDNLRSFTFPEGITSIGHNAFYGCVSLESVVIPEGVTQLYNGIFNGCSSLTSVVLPASLTEIGTWAFASCKSLNRITAGMTVPPSIGNSVFDFQEPDIVLIVPEGCLEAYEAAEHWKDFMQMTENVDNTTPAIDFADNTVKTLCVEKWDVNGDGELSLYEAAHVKKLRGTFRDNDDIRTFDELQYFTALRDLDSGIFYGCDNLRSFTFPEGITSIGHNAFYGCVSLESVVIPEGVTQLYNGIFNGCSSLTSVVLPASLTEIGTWAFASCKSLNRITAGMTVPPSIGNSVFDFQEPDIVLIVPEGSLEAYESAECWKDFKKIIEGGLPVGDVNGDGEVGIADVVAVTNVMAGNEQRADVLLSADVNGDGEVGIADIVSITNIMAGH